MEFPGMTYVWKHSDVDFNSAEDNRLHDFPKENLKFMLLSYPVLQIVLLFCKYGRWIVGSFRLGFGIWRQKFGWETIDL